MTVEAWIELHNAYVRGRQLREAEMQMRAAQYCLEFEAAYQRRMEQRDADTKQWLTLKLPAIKSEAALLRYERGLDKESCDGRSADV